jgi:ADP-ribose pyrophosphatase
VPFLPEKPKVELLVDADRSSEREGFLSLKRYDLFLETETEEGKPSRSARFRYDLVDRRALDAAVMAAHYIEGGTTFVYLRSAVRPPIALREGMTKSDSVLWELPAGLIEPGEEPAAAAARELEEELGFSEKPGSMELLGPWAFPAPGFIGEVHWYFHVEVDPKTRKEPAGDGSPLENGARIVSVPLEEALAACQAGEIRDAKTELALRRLADLRA